MGSNDVSTWSFCNQNLVFACQATEIIYPTFVIYKKREKKGINIEVRKEEDYGKVDSFALPSNDQV